MADSKMDWLTHENLKEFVESKESNEPFACEGYLSSMIEHLGSTLKKESSKGAKAIRAKDNKESIKFRENGNKIFVFKKDAKGLEEALEWYTKSVAYAVPKSQDLAVSYANRSAVLIKLNRPKDCLDDINRALALDYPDKLKSKIFIRKAECFTQLSRNSYIESKILLKKLPFDNNRKTLEEKLKEYPDKKETEDPLDEEVVLPELKNRSKKFPSSSDAVEIRFTEGKGKHIVASRDIEPGEVLVIEKPYTKVPNQPNLYTHCSHCLRCIWTGIPCDNCVNSMYCSDECKTLAWKQYHETECPVFDLMLQYNIKGSEAVALRILLQANVESGGWAKLKERIKKLEATIEKSEGHVDSEWYKNDKNPLLEGIFSQMRKLETLPEDVTKESSMIALRTVFFLATTTKFFGEQYDRKKKGDNEILSSMSKNPDFKLAAQLLVKLSHMEFTMFSEDEGGDLRVRGKAAMPFVSLLKHSCFANTHEQYKRNHVVIYAAVPIKKGETVSGNYGETYKESTKEERQAALEQKHHMTCRCIACEEDWPLIEDLASYEDKAKSDASKEKIKKALKTLPDLQTKIQEKKLGDKTKMLKELNGMAKTVYEGVDMPCKNVEEVLGTVRNVYRMTGNIAKVATPQEAPEEEQS